MKCTLNVDNNTCPFLKNKDCTNPNKCSFQEKPEEPRNKYVREPRWYEKYYK